MNYILSLSIALMVSLCAISQDYWQQEVNYKIDVELDDKTHFLNGYEEFEYINNSPTALDRIYIHLWPNAYRDGTTALARQLYESGNGILKYGSESDKGYIDSLDFKVNGNKANWELDPENPDICLLILPEALRTGGRVTISTPFRVKLPSGKISRLGHLQQSYQITQWYPKPAVYDKNGWNQMPYLNQGEFYSEYGSFDVSIRLPKNYVVGATGDLQTETELTFLDSIAEVTAKNLPTYEHTKFNSAKVPNSIPLSSTEYKTIRYVQKNVHDFAWFADKRYQVLKSEVSLPHSQRKVTSWAMFTPRNAALWKNSSEYLNDAIHYYSLWNGDYPYNQVTAVDGTISAGGGMEYPNVTVIGNSNNAEQLEVVIVHEVGHNWFYGQLGSNERIHGWMDEGMNTLNEVRYMQTKYPNNTAMTDMLMGTKFHFDELDHHDMGDISYRLIAGMGEDQPIETHSAEFTSANYGIVMYQKTGLVFYYLKDYLGDELFNSSMQQYYKNWEFKHPQPEDMKKSLEAASGKSLDWLFNDLIQTTRHIDYKIKNVKDLGEGKYLVKIKNKGQVDGPVEINSRQANGLVNSTWIDGAIDGRKSTVTLNANEPVEFRIDFGRDIPEMNRQNNIYKTKGLLHKFEKPKIEFLVGDNEEDRSQLFWTPMIGGNAYDKFMIGLTMHNFAVPFNRFTYMITPLYSFGRKMVSGTADFSFVRLPSKRLKTERWGVSINSFKHDSTFRNNDSYYIAVSPYWNAKLGNRGKAKNYAQDVQIKTLYRKDLFGPTHLEHIGIWGEYNFSYVRPDHKVSFKVRNEYLSNVKNQDAYGRALAEATYAFRYMRNKQKRWVSLRVFGGQQYLRSFSPANGYQYSMSLSGSSGQQDWFIDEYYFARNEINGFWSQQRQENMGGFKSASYYGTSSIGLMAANLYFQLPIPTGIFGIYADAGAFHNGIGLNQVYQLGGAIRLGDFVGLYFPIWMSQELNDSFGENAKYGQKIRISLKMNLLNKPLNLSSLL